MKMLECIHRVLKPEGIFVSITFGQVREILIVPMHFPWISFTTIIHVGFIYFWYSSTVFHFFVWQYKNLCISYNFLLRRTTFLIHLWTISHHTAKDCLLDDEISKVAKRNKLEGEAVSYYFLLSSNLSILNEEFSYGSHTFDADFLKLPSLHGLLSIVPLVTAFIISSTLLRRLIRTLALILLELINYLVGIMVQLYMKFYHYWNHFTP